VRCPACQSPALEDDAACRQCGFTLESVDQLFGIAPMLERPITDLADALSPGERSEIAKAVRALERRFPQISLAVVLAPVPDGVNAATWAFWLFNRGSLFSAVEKGGANHGVLLLVDTVHDQALVALGYGLEPFVAENALRSCLTESAISLKKKRYAAAIVDCISKLAVHFTEACEKLPRLFGYHENGVWADASRAMGSVESQEQHEEDLF
jgi:uncharacterized membrane protein YgcG